MATPDPSESTRIAKRVLLVGLEGVDWSAVQGALQAGGLPTLAALLHSGVAGDLTTPSPPISPSVWTSLITGQYAHKHDVLTAVQPGKGGLGTAPISRATVRTATLGAILSESGLTVHQIGWPVSHPIEQLRGIAVSDRFASERAIASSTSGGGWPWVTPPSAATELFARHRKPADIEEVTLAQLLPADVCQQSVLAQLEPVCRVILAESLTVFIATRWAMQHSSWDCTLCTFNAIAQLSQALAQVLPTDDAETLKARVLSGCYEHLDMLLGQLIASAGEDATIMIVGLDQPAPRRAHFVMQSSAIAKDAALPDDASVLDVTPTLLALLGVPSARDMDGRAWSELFHIDESEIAPVDSWDGCVHAPPTDADAARSEAARTIDDSVQHLVELGYVDPLETHAKEQASLCARDTRYNRALSLLDAGLQREAIDELEVLKRDFPDWQLPYELLAEIFLQRDDVDSADQTLEYLVHRGAASARLYFALGRIAAAQRNWEAALSHYHVAEKIGKDLRGLQLAQGLVRLRLRNFQAAEPALVQALESDGKSPQLLDQLAACCLGNGDIAKAVEYALAAVEVDVNYAPAHYHLGLALLQLGRPADAAQALELSATIDPSFVAPLRWLARISRDHLDDRDRAEAYRDRGRELIRRRRQSNRSGDA